MKKLLTGSLAAIMLITGSFTALAAENQSQVQIPVATGDTVLCDTFDDGQVDWWMVRGDKVFSQDNMTSGNINATDAFYYLEGNLGFIAIQGLNTVGVNPYITKRNGTYNKYILNATIKNDYIYKGTYQIINFSDYGTPATTGNLTCYTTVTNRKYMLKYSLESDGVWAYTSDNVWSKIIDCALPVEKDIETVCKVNSNKADIYISYLGEADESIVLKGSYVMPASTDTEDVKIGMVIAQKNGNEILREKIFIKSVQVTNTTDYDVLVHDYSTPSDAKWVSYDNIEKTAFADICEGVENLDSFAYGTTGQYDLIDSTKKGSITYTLPTDGRIKDFTLSRKLEHSNQGNIMFYLTDSLGNEKSLVNGTDFVEVPGYYKVAHYYMYEPTDSLKAEMASGRYSKLRVELLCTGGGGAANATSPAIVRSYIAYDIPDEAYSIKDSVYQVNEEDGNAVIFAHIVKELSTAPEFRLIAVSYDDNGGLVDVGIGEYVKHDEIDKLYTSPRIKPGALYKLFLWEQDENGNLTQIPVITANLPQPVSE